MHDLIKITENKEVLTDSLKVAEFFGKEHKYILKRIKLIIQTGTVNGGDFAPVYYIDSKGEQRLKYLINRDGFILLALGFTGKNAHQFKVEYIRAFNKSIDVIQKQQKQLAEQSKQLISENQTLRLLTDEAQTENKLFKIKKALEQRGEISETNGMPKTCYMSFMRTPYKSEYQMVPAPDDLGMFPNNSIMIKVPKAK